MFRTYSIVSIFLYAIVSSLAAEKPNIVYIMSDELAYYELSHMGNPYIRTPRIGRMAREGLRFTQALAAAPVCAPLRAALMTGKHMGHASVRANDGGTPLRAEEETIASILKKLGYATGGFGKWGAGGRGSTGVPEQHGFDVLPTLAQLTNATMPPDMDGLSILPTLLGEAVVGHKQKQHEFLYWEHRQQTAVRMKCFKAVKPRTNAPWELYDLGKDISEKNNIANNHPELLAKMKAFAKASHEPVRKGTFADRSAHERDRWAKWGTSGQAPKPKKRAKSRK